MASISISSVHARVSLWVGAGILLLLLYIFLNAFFGCRLFVPSIWELYAGETHVSSGLSRSMAAFVKGDMGQALQFNRHGPAVFLFFAIQLVVRIVVLPVLSAFPGYAKEILLADVTVSIVMCMVSFLPFILSLVDALLR